jgi:hypothetical protein
VPANGKRLRRSTQHTCTSGKARCKHVRGSARDLVHPPAPACGVQNKRVKGRGRTCARACARPRTPHLREHNAPSYALPHASGHERDESGPCVRTGTSKLNSPHNTHTAIHARANSTHTTPYRASKHASPQARTCVHRAHTRRGTSGSTRRPQRRAYAPSSFTPLGCPLWRSATAFCCSDLGDGARTVAGRLSGQGR